MPWVASGFYRSPVVGFDDIPAAKLITPQLTTVHQPMAEKGRLAVLSLLQEKGPLRVQLPTKLLIRRSTTGAAAQGETEVEIR